MDGELSQLNVNGGDLLLVKSLCQGREWCMQVLIYCVNQRQTNQQTVQCRWTELGFVRMGKKIQLTKNLINVSVFMSR